MVEAWPRLCFRHGLTLIHTVFLRSYREAHGETRRNHKLVPFGRLRASSERSRMDSKSQIIDDMGHGGHRERSLSKGYRKTA